MFPNDPGTRPAHPSMSTSVPPTRHAAPAAAAAAHTSATAASWPPSSTSCSMIWLKFIRKFEAVKRGEGTQERSDSVFKARLLGQGTLQASRQAVAPAHWR